MCRRAQQESRKLLEGNEQGSTAGDRGDGTWTRAGRAVGRGERGLVTGNSQQVTERHRLTELGQIIAQPHTTETERERM